MANLVQFKQPISTLITQNGTKVEKAIANMCMKPGNPRTYIPANIALQAKTGTVGKLITFGPNSKSKFAQAGYDQVMLSTQPHDSGLKTKLISLFKNGTWCGDIWFKPNGKISGIENSIERAKRIGLKV